MMSDIDTFIKLLAIDTSIYSIASNTKHYSFGIYISCISYVGYVFFTSVYMINKQ